MEIESIDRKKGIKRNILWAVRFHEREKVRCVECQNMCQVVKHIGGN